MKTHIYKDITITYNIKKTMYISALNIKEELTQLDSGNLLI